MKFTASCSFAFVSINFMGNTSYISYITPSKSTESSSRSQHEKRSLRSCLSAPFHYRPYLDANPGPKRSNIPPAIVFLSYELIKILADCLVNRNEPATHSSRLFDGYPISSLWGVGVDGSRPRSLRIVYPSQPWVSYLLSSA